MGGTHSAFPTAPVVLSMTTVPWRLHDDFARKVISLLDGLPAHVELHLNVPHVLQRKRLAYPPIPPALQTHPRISVFRTHDYGPITKLIPTLHRALGKPVLIVVLDDDNVYSPRYVRALVNGMTPHTRFIRSKLAHLHGQTFPQGYSGIAIPMPLITRAIIHWLETATGSPGARCFTSDDFVQGFVFQRAGIPMRMFNFAPIGKHNFSNSQSRKDEHALYRQGHYHTYKQCKAELAALQPDRARTRPRPL